MIDRLVRDIRHAGGVGRKPIEQATGRGMHLVDEDQYFRSYTATASSEGPVTFGLDLREPKQGSGATGGALLVVNVKGDCPPRAALEARYGPWRLTEVPRGRSPDEQAYWTHAEPWGELSFGFAEKAPDCLRTVVFRNPDAH